MPKRAMTWVSMIRGFVLCLGLVTTGCAAETPPRPDDAPPAANATDVAATATYEPSMPAVLTFAGERGQFADANTPTAIPEASRGLVRVALLDGPAPPPQTVWVGNFRNADGDGKVSLSTVPRDAFEELALGQGLSSAYELPAGLAPPEVAATKHNDVIVYKTSWCGVCKQVEAYLSRKGTKFTSKDIENDADAAAELRAKASAQNVPTRNVPIIDVRGELLVGFDRARLEQLL